MLKESLVASSRLIHDGWRLLMLYSRHSHRKVLVLWSILLAGIMNVMTVTTCHADQFVLFDTTFTYTKQDADTSRPHESHIYLKGAMLNEARPKDWLSPIDYRNGTVHVRLEVLEKPDGDEPTMWSVCYIPNKGLGQGYGCIGTGAYTQKGVHEKDIPMTSFWHNEDLDWSQGIKEMHLVIKDGKGVKGHLRPDPEKFFPTKIRMTLIQVSKGSTYDPSLVPGLANDQHRKDK